MPKPYQNQHYVSQVLQRRFADNGYLQRFSLKWNKWKRISPEQVFSHRGYTQLLAYGELDNSLEESFQKIESAFRNTLEELDKAATQVSTVLPTSTYENLFWYCAYLWRLSPFAKAVAPLNYVHQLDKDLEHGRTGLLRLLGITEKDIRTILIHHLNGKKCILTGSDYLQVLFRIQFKIKCVEEYQILRFFTKWSICNSPIDLPLGDLAFFQFHDQPSNSHVYILSLSPRLVLVGKRKNNVQLHSSNDTFLKSENLTMSEAEYILDAICLAGLTAVIAKDRSYDITELRKRAVERGIQFVKIKNLEAVLSAGIKPFDGELRILPTTNEEYIKFTKSFVER